VAVKVACGSCGVRVVWWVRQCVMAAVAAARAAAGRRAGCMQHAAQWSMIRTTDGAGRPGVAGQAGIMRRWRAQAAVQ